MLGSIGFGMFGFTMLLGIGVVFSNNRSKINWQLVGADLLLQIIFALLVLLTETGRAVFESISRIFVIVLGFSMRGAEFILGDLAIYDGNLGFIFAFQVLPTIIFFASLMAVLYHIGLM